MSEYLETLVKNMLADDVSEKDIQKVIEEVTKKSPLRQNGDVTVTTGGTEGTGTREIVTGTTTTTQVVDAPPPVEGVDVKEEVEETAQEKCEKQEGMCWEPPDCVPCLEQEEGEAIRTEQEFEEAFDIQPGADPTAQEQEFIAHVEDSNIKTEYFVPSSLNEGTVIEATNEIPQHVIIPKYSDQLPGFIKAAEWFSGSSKTTIGKDTFIGKKEELNKYRWMDQSNRNDQGDRVSNDYFKNIEDQQNFQNAILNNNIQGKEILTDHDKYTLPDGKVEYVKKGEDTENFLFQYPNATLTEENIKVREFTYTTNVDGKEITLTPPSIRPENSEKYLEVKEYITNNTSKEFTKNKGYVLTRIITDELKWNPDFNIGRFVDDVFKVSEYDNSIKTNNIEALKDCIKKELFSELDQYGLPSKMGPLSASTYYWTPKGKKKRKIVRHNDLTKYQQKAIHEKLLNWKKVNLTEIKDLLPNHPALLYSIEKYFGNSRKFDKYEFNKKDVKALAKIYQNHVSGKPIDRDIEKLINSKIDVSGGKLSEHCISTLKTANQEKIVNASFHHENAILDKDKFVENRHRMIEGALGKVPLFWVIGAPADTPKDPNIIYDYGKDFEGLDRGVLKMLQQPYFNWLWQFKWEEGKPVTAVLNLEQYMRLDFNKMIDILDYQLPITVTKSSFTKGSRVYSYPDVPITSNTFVLSGFTDGSHWAHDLENYDRSTDTYDIRRLIMAVATGLTIKNTDGLIDLYNLTTEEVQTLDYEDTFNKHIKLDEEELNDVNKDIQKIKDTKFPPIILPDIDRTHPILYPYKDKGYTIRHEYRDNIGMVHVENVYIPSRHEMLYNKLANDNPETIKSAKGLYMQIYSLTPKDFQNLPVIPFETINNITLDLLTQQEKNKIREKKFGDLENYWIVSSQRVDRNFQIYREIINKTKILQYEADELLPYFEFKNYFVNTFLDKTKRFEFKVNDDGTYETAVVMKHPDDGSNIYVPLRLALKYTTTNEHIKNELPRILNEYNKIEDLGGELRSDQYLWASLMQRDHSYWAKWVDKVSNSIWGSIFGLTWTIGAGIQKTSDFAGWMANTEFENLTDLSNTVMQQSGVEIEALNKYYNIYAADQEWDPNPLTWLPKLGNLFADHVGLLASIIAGGHGGLALYLTGRNGASHGWFKWKEARWVDVYEDGKIVSKKKRNTGRILMNSLMLASSEYLIESWLTLPIISKWRKLLTNPAKREMIELAFRQQLVKEFGADFVANAFLREPLSELLTQIAHSWILQDGHWLSDWKNIYLDGAGLGIMFAGLPGMKNVLMSQFMSREQAAAMAKKAEEVIKLQVERAKLEKERKALKKKKRRTTKEKNRIKEIDAQIKKLKTDANILINELHNEIVELEGLVKKLSKRALNHYIWHLAHIAGIKAEAQRIWDDNTMSDRLKQAKLKKLKKDFDLADMYLQFFLDPASFGDPSNLFFGNSNNNAEIERYKREAEKKLISEGNKNPSEKEIEDQARDLWKNDEIWKDIEKIKKAGAGKDLQAYQTVEEAITAINNIFNKLINNELDQNKKNSLKEKRDDLIESIKTGNQGINIPPGITKGNVIEIVVVDNMVAQDRMETRPHEQWHTISLKLFKVNPEALEEWAKAVENFVEKNYPKLYVEMQLEVERYKKDSPKAGKLKPDEVLAWFVEKVSSGQITLKNDANTTVLGSMFLEAIHNATKDKDGNGVAHLKFDNNDQIIEFMVGIAKAIKDGLLDTETMQTIENVQVKSTISEAIKEMVRKRMEGVQTQDVVKSSAVVDYYKAYKAAEDENNQSEMQKQIFNILEEYKGMAIAITERYRYNVEDFNVYRDDIETELLTSDRGIYGMILDYNPESADYIYDDGAGGTNTVSVIYNKKGIVRVDNVEIKELENASRETVTKYITDNFGDIVKRNQIPLDGYINKYIGVRSSDIVSGVTGKKPGEGYVVRSDEDVDIWNTDFGEDNNGTGFDESFDNITTAVKHGVWRKILNILKGDALYEETKTIVINTFNNIDPNNVVLDANGDIVSIKDEKAFRQQLKVAFEQALVKKIKEILGTQKSAKFKEFLEGEVTIDGQKVSIQRILTDMLAVKYRNRFPELSTHGGTMDTGASLEAQTNDDQSFVTSTTAGNDIWIKNYDLTTEEFTNIFIEGRETRYKSFINAMANELALDAVFDVLPKNWENHAVRLQDIIKRDQSIKFSNYVSPLGNVIHIRLDKKIAKDDAALQKMEQRIERLAYAVDKFVNIDRVIDLETLEVLVTVFDENGVEVEFTPFEVAVVVDAFDNGILKDAKSEKFIAFLEHYKKENPNAAGVINNFLNESGRNIKTKNPKTEEGRKLLDELWNDFAKIQLRLGEGFNNILDKDKSMWGHHNRYNDVAGFKWGPKRTDVDSSGKVRKFSKGNQSGGGSTSYQIEGWEFIPEKGIFRAGNLTSKDPVTEHGAKKVRGRKYKDFIALQAKIKKQGLTGVLDPEVLENVRLMNIGFDLFKKIQRILDKKITRDEKIKELNIVDPSTGLSIAQEIELANEANKEVVVAVVTEVFKMIGEGEVSAKNGIHWLQMQTNLVGGIRAFSGLHYLTIEDGSAKDNRKNKVLLDKKGGIKNVKVYGEHVEALTVLNKKLIKILFEYLNFDANGNLTSVNKSYDLKGSINKAFNNFTQLLTDSFEASKMDGFKIINGVKVGGPTYEGDRTVMMNEENVTNAIGETVKIIKTKHTAQNVVVETTQAREEENEKNEIRNNLIANSATAPYIGSTNLDFDLTIAESENYVLATKEGFKPIKLDGKKWAEDGERLLNEGWSMDFTNFDELTNPKKGPVWPFLIKQLIRFGNEVLGHDKDGRAVMNITILTARGPKVAQAILEYLNSTIDAYNEKNDTNVPHLVIENIVALGNSTGEAKANWIEENHVFNGVNDIVFIDDHLPNVQAVQDMMDSYPEGYFRKGGKSIETIQEVKASQSIEFNKILERTTGIAHNKKYSAAQGKLHGRGKGRFQFLLNPNANDFEGLLYAFLAKGEQGKKDMEFFRKNLIIPFNQANTRIDARKQRLKRDYRKLRKDTPGIKKTLKEKILRADGSPSNFTNEQAVRVYLWLSNGYNVPELSYRDAELLFDTVDNNIQLKTFAKGLQALVDMKEGYLAPTSFWLSETLISDLYTISNEIGRDHELQEFIKNKDQIFSAENLDKIEAAFGEKFRNALEEMLYKMQYGRPKSYANMGKLEREWLDWVNGSTGAIMFLNMRSAVLQTLSVLNYIELAGPNNIVGAGKAFANQKQFWDDFGMIWYSDFLVQRRESRGIDVNMRDLHQYLGSIHGTQVEKAKAAIAWLLEKGFLPTQLADSFAIAFGGASYYRNYVDYFISEGYSREDAEEMAWEMFEEETVTTQQSTRVDKLGYEQSSILGKFLLNFKVTPMQYVRKITKAVEDLRAGRGSAKQHIATILYYGVLQNLMFVGLQQAVFAALFDEDDEWEKREDKIIKSMLDNILYGMGLEGVMIVTVKNGVLEFFEQQEKGWNADHTYTILQVANMSPVIGSKLRKIYQSIQAQKFNKDAIAAMKWYDIQNPAWSSVASLIEGAFNIPAERAHRKIKNILIATSKSGVYVVKDKTAEKGWRLEETGTPPASAEMFEIAVWQRISLLLGWAPWDVNLTTKEKLIKQVIKGVKADKKEEKKKQEQEKINEKEQQKEITARKNDPRDDAQKEEIRCIAVTKRNPRCKMPIVPGKKYCTIHEKVPQRVDNEKVTCKGVRTNGNKCKNLTSNKSGYCYLHD